MATLYGTLSFPASTMVNVTAESEQVRTARPSPLGAPCPVAVGERGWRRTYMTGALVLRPRALHDSPAEAMFPCPLHTAGAEMPRPPLGHTPGSGVSG